jgi:hypothetical protein
VDTSPSACIFLLQSFPVKRIIAHLFFVGDTNAQLPLGRRVSLLGHSHSRMPAEPESRPSAASPNAGTARSDLKSLTATLAAEPAALSLSKDITIAF